MTPGQRIGTDDCHRDEGPHEAGDGADRVHHQADHEDQAARREGAGAGRGEREREDDREQGRHRRDLDGLADGCEGVVNHGQIRRKEPADEPGKVSPGVERAARSAENAERSDGEDDEAEQREGGRVDPRLPRQFAQRGRLGRAVAGRFGGGLTHGERGGRSARASLRGPAD